MVSLCNLNLQYTRHSFTMWLTVGHTEWLD